MHEDPHLPNIDAVQIAKDYVRDEPAFVSSLDFGPFVAQGTGSGPSVLIGDQAEINLIHSLADKRLDHRMALLARNGDIVLVRARDAEFEAYLANCLGLSDVRFIQVDDDPLTPVTQQARTSDEILKILANTATAHGGLTLQAYLTTGNLWRLAQAIGERSGQCIHVCGPSPRATRRANDKLWFTRLARQIIGTEATPPTLSAYGPAAAAGLVRRISRSAAQVIVKVPDSAGSAGNIRLDNAQVRDLSLAELRYMLLSRLYATGWHDRYPILVGVWDANVTHSPSVQLWLPHAADGDPVVEGIFEQRVQDATTAFAGAAPSTLPMTMQKQLAAQARRVGRVLQRLGYFGRCSFDAVICENPGAPAVIHWIECNGRWGGVSIPMTIASRLAPDGYVSIVQEVIPDIRLQTDILCDVLNDLLFQNGGSQTGLVILSPPLNPNGLSVNLLAIAETQKAANDLLAGAMQRLVGRSSDGPSFE
ncbi:hypothetical protein [uncultured Tateyamaria sp.]|uniref:preATP grasp domain-containing protein n=1 Tax=uncultured Tateyamaria sp. TaxID=455651 RepID=UPI00262FD449|nr:hypothetical protein [uncultured Tateyamaria sp.]